MPIRLTLLAPQCFSRACGERGAPYAFNVDCGNVVVDTWNRLNPKVSGGDAERRRGAAEPFKEGEAGEDAQVLEPLANHRVLV